MVAIVAAIVVCLSVAPRILGAVGALPPGLYEFGWSDILATWNDSRLPGHRVPYVDVPFAYPPVVGYIAGAISLIGDGYLAYALGWGAVIVVAAAGGAFAFAHHAGPRRALLYWAVAPQMLLLSGVNFDVLAAVFLGTAAIAARDGRDRLAAALLGLGTATKLFPAVSLPVCLWRLLSVAGRRRAIVAGAVFAVTLGILYLPASIAAFPATRFVGIYAALGANVDSPWILAERLIAGLGVDGHLVVLALTYTGFALTYLFVVLPRARTARDPAAVFGLATVSLLLWTRLYSPQYSLWLLPFFVLLPLRLRSFVLLTIADLGVFFTIYPLTLVIGDADPLRTPIFAALFTSVALRVVALVVVWRDILRVAEISR